jgi:hypothetical protein
MVSTWRLSLAERAASNARLRANGGFIFADARNAVTSAAATALQVSMHRNTLPPRGTRSSRASSLASIGFTTTVLKNPSPARSFPLLTRIRWINRRPDRMERCLQTGKRNFTNRPRTPRSGAPFDCLVAVMSGFATITPQYTNFTLACAPGSAPLAFNSPVCHAASAAMEL